MKLARDYPEVIEDAKRRGLLVVHEKHWHHPDKGICIVWCKQCGPDGECDQDTEKLCWIHQESLEKDYHLACANTLEGTVLASELIEKELRETTQGGQGE